MEVNKYLDMYDSQRSKKKMNSLRMKFNLATMTAFCEYALSNNSSVHRSGLVNLRNLLNQIDPDISLDNNKSLIDRYNFCQDVLRSRLDKNLTRRELIVEDVRGIVADKYPDLDIEGFNEISTNDVIWIEGDLVPKCLNAALINNSVYDLQEECMKYINADPSQYPLRIQSLYKAITDIYNQKRKNDVDADEADSLFQLSKFEDTVTAIWNSQKAGGYKLRTGMQSLNKMIAGGFEERRVYCIFGLPGEGKTVTLLNLLYQLKKYNADVQTKDPTLKPCILLLTMENFIHEEVQTLYNITVANENISDRPLDAVLDDILNSDAFKDQHGNDNPIDIFIKFKPINSVTTDYLYKITEDLKDLGYEVICLLQDYIMRIKSAESNNVEDRVRWGNIINEFKNYSMFYSIPVITAAQLNRDAARTIDSYRREGKFDDMIDHIGRANIAESSQIDFNLDAIIFIAPCQEGDNKWQAFKLIKKRYKADLLPSDYIFFQPFVTGMPARFEEDFGRTKPLSRPNLFYDAKASTTAQAFSKAQNSTGARFSANKNLKEDGGTVVMKAKSNETQTGFVLGLSDMEVKNDSKVFLCEIMQNEELDDTIFKSMVQEIRETMDIKDINPNARFRELDEIEMEKF